MEERWSAVLAPAGSGRRILAVAAHLPGETVYSPARVLGNGELKFKYLNPNTLLVAVGPPAGGRGEQTLTVALLDAVTGRTLFSQAHEVRGDGTGCGGRCRVARVLHSLALPWQARTRQER